MAVDSQGNPRLTDRAVAPICPIRTNQSDFVVRDIMRLASLADYAIVILSAAARRCGARGRLNATLLAEETGVPLPTVQKLVSKLSAAGLIETLRGTGGGLRLARDRKSTRLNSSP